MNTKLEDIIYGATDVISIVELGKRLTCKKQLIIKFGVDPTAPDLHLGHTVILNKLRHLQTLGHKVLFLIGDFTALIGDPSGRSTTRPVITKQEIKNNVQTYVNQVSKILDITKTEIVYNSSWFNKMSINEILNLTTKSTVAQMLTRKDFDKRYKENRSISIREFLYPLLQAYDSVILQPDIEIGGHDQKFNLILGREVQKNYGMKNIQIIITMPILEGMDGVRKMSKSYNNYIALNDTCTTMFGKIMSISDELMYKYYKILTNINISVVKQMHPKEAKCNLAHFIVKQYYGNDNACEAKQSFNKVFIKKEFPNNLITQYITFNEIQLSKLLVLSKMCSSKKEAQRLIQQGGIKINSQKVMIDYVINLKEDFILQVGKRRFQRIRLNNDDNHKKT
ncbi:MAG: tyrosine--tRNA ligase [Endomicrobium sp.]|jgi:tyrosyl-tRNA synthetase|nr:tyrosine--tRNA ligase [Endomicrobium sp.]